MCPVLEKLRDIYGPPPGGYCLVLYMNGLFLFFFFSFFFFFFFFFFFYFFSFFQDRQFNEGKLFPLLLGFPILPLCSPQIPFALLLSNFEKPFPFVAFGRRYAGFSCASSAWTPIRLPHRVSRSACLLTGDVF